MVWSLRVRKQWERVKKTTRTGKEGEEGITGRKEKETEKNKWCEEGDNKSEGMRRKEKGDKNGV